MALSYQLFLCIQVSNYDFLILCLYLYRYYHNVGCMCMMWTYMFAYLLRTELTMCFQDKVGHRSYHTDQGSRCIRTSYEGI